ILREPFPTYPAGFPNDLIHRFESLIGRRTLGNCVASGTEIIQRLGQQHVETGWPIVYTSADSVFQIAAHEAVIPPEQLYTICRQARELLVPPHAVGRVIARPFTGQAPDWQRTSRRRDFSLAPICPTLLDQVTEAGRQVLAVGKISDIFAGRGISQSWKTENNQAGIEQTIELMSTRFSGLLMVNLVDFDMLYGHRNDRDGYAGAMMDFDRQLPRLVERTGPEDLLMITADHGCDPTFPGSDHTREAVPLIMYSPAKTTGRNLGTRQGFQHIAATAAKWLGLSSNDSSLL
ncbi:MAG: phosphopentomutase, partial [Clostridia bacterium]|nr:phosphopentomutase [Clostridia bacterium]